MRRQVGGSRTHQIAGTGPPAGVTTTNNVGRGVYERVTGPTGTRYLMHAVPSGHLGFSAYLPQGPVEALIQTVGVKIVNRVIFRLANRWPQEYERRWAWMFPAWFLYVELEALK